MPLLNQKYPRAQAPTLSASKPQSTNIIEVLRQELYTLCLELDAIEEAKAKEPELRKRISVVQNSLEAFAALEAPEEEIQVQEPSPKPAIRKASPRKAAKPTESSIAKTPEVSDTEIVKDEFSVFPD